MLYGKWITIDQHFQHPKIQVIDFINQIVLFINMHLKVEEGMCIKNYKQYAWYPFLKHFYYFLIFWIFSY